MSKLQNTYRKVSLLLPAVYIFAFLLSPYFHHHSDEEVSFNKDQFHSHLLNTPIKEASQKEEHSHSVDEPSQFHFHFVKLSSAPTISTKRIVNIIPTFIAGINIARLNEANNYPHKRIDVKPKNLKTQERYVLSAANVSPPLV
ncbi:MAG: hypothetical protein K9J16_14875 [Melioribacteraceae bacterium]|nr:hypothetical protein [Melioribacteraceae bacterium]MCF8356251.1 hypothetical protein [Melioribacteraceae bacterium]MCF8395429.1 hypothetical protein [Melioribacteraceae bacterium]MCF8420763.1 hypothetical protein [Melioribacteraceae bacterium]